MATFKTDLKRIRMRSGDGRQAGRKTEQETGSIGVLLFPGEDAQREKKNGTKDGTMYTDFTTRELALAAFLKARGYEPTLDVADSSGFVTFRFDDADGTVDRLASDFLRSAEVPALPYFHALNDLRSAIRFVRGGGR